ncbi:hypothetical protein [Streptomyces sp. P17]|uniref:hypothetical protein n=1 Tax=Streptomyces sp. P17 TaxID=3074716 RepID=UPI0028F45DE2|nr:hypothetical protein [Streptomyces sp. P17]MDT9700408.1 hypothetical protein [Streptomyces sp. P17]
MHRTTTTTALLVSVAVSALAGCVTVQRPPVSGPVRAPAQPSAPQQDGRAEPQIVQAPAQEALELIGPPRRTEHKPPATQRPTQSAPAPAAPPAPPPTPRSHPRPAHPRPEERPAPPRSRVEIPDVTESVRKNTDVCALGKKYGGWRKDSPEARICERTYGR